MSRTVDERIVEMRFDNRQFEQNIQTTMGSLDKLKQSLKLDGVTKGFQDLDRASRGISLNNISSGVETITKRFSTLGIIGMEITRKLTDGFINLATKGIGGLVSKITEGGKRRAANIENAHFQLQGLLKDEEKVQAIMSDAMGSVDGTAYAYDEAAKAASQFAASGLEAGKQMQSSLRAITGVAAMTNSEYEDISRIFTTVAGNGRLMGDQLLQLSGRGLNAAATLKDYFNGVGDGSIEAEENVATAIKSLSNGLDVSEGDIREWVSKGKLSFEIFSAAMDDAFGEHAKKANETFTGALSNINAALSRTGAKFYSPLIEQNGALVQLFNTIRERINDVNKGMDGFANLFVRNVIKGANALKDFLSNVDTQKRIFEIMPKLYHTAANSLYVLQNVLTAVGRILKPIGQAFQYFIPNDILDRIRSFTSDLLKLTKGLSVSESTVSKVYKSFRGLFSIFDIGVRLITSFIRAFTPSSSEISKFANSILDSTASIGDWIYNLDLAIKKNDSFFKFFSKVKDFLEPIFKSISGFAQGIGGVLSLAGDGIKKFIDSVKEGTNINFNLSGFDSFKTLLENIGNTASKVFGSIFAAISNAFRRVSSFFGSMIPGLKQVSNALSSIFKTISNSVKNGISSEDINKVSKLISTGLLVGISLSVTNALNQLQGTFKSFNSGISGIFKGITDNFGKFSVDLKTDFGQITPVLSQFKDTLKAYQTELNAKALKEIAAAIAILAASLFVINLIDPNRLAQSTTALAALFAQLLTSFKVLAVISAGSKGDLQLSVITSSMIKMSAALLVMAAALKTIGDLDAKKLRNGFLAISGLMWEMVGVTTALSGMDKKLKAGTAGMISFAIALRIIAGAIKTLGDIDQDKLVNGLLTLGLTMGAMVIAFNSFNAKHAVSIGAGMLLMATAMTIMGGALKIMGSLNLEQLVTALAALAGTMFILVSTFNSLGKANMLVTAVSMTVLAGALVVLGGALKIMGSLNLEQLVTALAALAGTMFILVSTFNSLGKANMLVTASSMLILSNALVVMGGAIKLLGSLNFEQLLIALAALAGSMLILGAAFKLLGSANMLVTAGAMTIMAYALNSLAIALKMLGSLNLAQLGVALGALAGTFIILGVAASVLAPLIPAILGLAGALALIGASVALAGVGIAFFASGLGTLVAVGLSGLKEFMNIVKSSMKETLILLGAGIVSLAAIFAVLGVGASVLTPLIPSIIGLAAAFALLGVGVAAIGYGADHLSMAFERLTKVGPNGMKVVVEMIKILGESINTIVEMAVNGIVGFIKMMADKTPELLGSFAKIIEALLAYFVRVAPEVAESGLMLITALLTSIRNHIGDIVTLGIEIVVNYINAIKSKIGDLIQAGIDLAISFINGLASGIDNNSDRFINAIDHLISSVLSLLVKAALKFVDRGADFITKLLSGINKMQGEILKKIVDLAAQFLEKIGVKSKWVQKGRDFIQGLIDGFVEMRDQAVKLIKSIGKNIIGGITGVFDEHSPSKEAYKIGAFFMRGMDNGFIEYGKRVQGSAVRISEDILDTFKTTMSAVSDYISSDYEPTITPVMDLSNVTAGAGDINKLFENTKTQELAWQASANGNFNVMTDLTKQLNSKFDSFSNDDVVSEIAGLRSDMAAMNERLGRMQVVMDTGTLVGALGPGMDNYLGNMSVLAGRGV